MKSLKRLMLLLLLVGVSGCQVQEVRKEAEGFGRSFGLLDMEMMSLRFSDAVPFEVSVGIEKGEVYVDSDARPREVKVPEGQLLMVEIMAKRNSAVISWLNGEWQKGESQLGIGERTRFPFELTSGENEVRLYLLRGGCQRDGCDYVQIKVISGDVQPAQPVPAPARPAPRAVEQAGAEPLPALDQLDLSLPTDVGEGSGQESASGEPLTCEEKILAEPKEYVIQLAAVTDEAALRDWLWDQDLTDEACIIVFASKEKGILFGAFHYRVYDTAAEGAAVIRSWPPSRVRYGAYVRSIAELVTAVEAVKEVAQ